MWVDFGCNCRWWTTVVVWVVVGDGLRLYMQVDHYGCFKWNVAVVVGVLLNAFMRVRDIRKGDPCLNINYKHTGRQKCTVLYAYKQ